MPVGSDFRRVPIESSESVVLFANARIALVLTSIVLGISLGFPFEEKLVGLLAGVALPWSVAVLVLARRVPDVAMSPWMAAGDFVVLGIVQLVVPEIYALYRFVALFFVAVHSHFQGERRGVTLAAGGSGVVIAARAIAGDGPIRGDLLFLYEAFFAAAALSSAVVIGRLRTAESASRLRARDLTRRTLRSEGEIRRRVAESIHDGPVQELIGLDMMLAAANTAAEQGDHGRAAGLVADARKVAEKNVEMLRDEIVDLGPFAFAELSFAQGVENCVSIWERRYGIKVLLALEDVEMPPETAGHLFRITQEATVNAGRHGEAKQVSISLRSLDGSLELRVMDDGKGFGDVDPLGPSEPGHLGLAAMRERAELLDGTLRIESSELGTKVVATAPLVRRPRGRQRPP
jgi:signal transduction histidine kinase